MKQVLQNFSNGETKLEEVPNPILQEGHVLIRTVNSVISPGSEKMLVSFGKANLLNKARQQPERVNQVLQKVRTDGLSATLSTVRSKLDTPFPLGYSNAGIVEESRSTKYRRGDRVVSNGFHAEFVSVPENLVAKIPDSVDMESASFTTIGAIALQSIRIANPTLGESVAVIGLGLVGLLAVQILKANGCRVLGIDLDKSRLQIAEKYGASIIDVSGNASPSAIVDEFTRGIGLDSVIIAASTSSNDPIDLAASVCRKRGRIVLVGTSGLQISRDAFYKKELSFQVSCSYGPGRYDDQYELHGHDYPVGFVRWTEQRNFQAFLDLLSAGNVDTSSLISHRFSIEESVSAYQAVMTDSSSLGVVLSYDADVGAPQNTVVSVRDSSDARNSPASKKPNVSFIGAGNYAKTFLIPKFIENQAILHGITSRSGFNSSHLAKKFGFKFSAPDWATLLEDASTDVAVIATRHDTHAEYVCDAIRRNIHVFVEKPLAISKTQLNDIIETYEGIPEGKAPILTVGFNRRFSPHARTIKRLLDTTDVRKSFVMTVNAGEVPVDSWIHDEKVGGGRVIGEVCHFLDLLRYLSGHRIVDYDAVVMDSLTRDTLSITLKFIDGSIGTIHYFSNGHKNVPKERLEVFCGNKILYLDNFRKLTGSGWKGFKKQNLRKQDKGQFACVNEFMQSVEQNTQPPISIAELIEVSEIAIEIQSLC